MDNNSEKLIVDLERGLQNRWLRDLITDTICQCTLWLLEIETDEFRDARLLYGWIIRRDGRPNQNWVVRRLTNWNSIGVDTDKYRLVAINLTQTGSTILSVIRFLLNGNTLTEACKEAGLLEPELGKNLRLNIEGAMQPQYLVGPVTFLPTSDEVSFLGRRIRGPQSPNHWAPAWSLPLGVLQKQWLWSDKDGNRYPNFEKMIERLASCLREETGFNFRDESAIRFGTLEWIALPSTDARESPYVDIHFHQAGERSDSESISVDITLPTGLDAKQLQIQLQTESNVGRLVDRICNVSVSKQQASILFEDLLSIGWAVVRVYVPGDKDQWDLWYSHAVAPLRQIRIRMSLMGTQVALNSDWLKKLAETKAKDRVERIRKFHQENRNVSFTVGDAGPLWQEAGEQIRRELKQLYPPETDGAFIDKGWDSPSLGAGRLTLFEWLLDRINKVNTGRLMIVDPFFDEVGIEVLARIQRKGVAISVLTNTQARSINDLSSENDQAPEGTSEDEKTAEIQEPPRARLIISACKSLQGILSGVKFAAYDVRSKGGGRSQLFHDRYILFFNGEDKPHNGYHISNSLQGATRKHPLLITPIPERLLGSVYDYIQTLLKESDRYHLIQLWPPSEPDNSAATTVVRGQTIKKIRPLLATLLDDPSLDEADEQQVRSALTVLDVDPDPFTVTNKLIERLPHLNQALISATDNAFVKLWIAVSSFTYNSVEGDKLYKALAEVSSVALPEKLSRQILSFARSEEYPVAAYAQPGIGHLIDQNFRSVIHDVRYLFSHPRFSSGHNGLPIRTAIRFLLDAAPEYIDNAFTGIIDKLRTANPAEEPLLRNTADILISELAGCLIIKNAWDKKKLELLRAGTPVVRAIGVHSIAHALTPQAITDNWRELKKALLLIDDCDRRHAAAEIVNELRVYANRANEDKDESKNARQLLMKCIIETWNESIDDNELRELFSRVSGPGIGSWSDSTYKELFNTLIEERKLDSTRIVDLYSDLLDESYRALLGEGKHLFSASRDVELTNITSWLIITAESQVYSRWIDRFQKWAQDGLLLVQRPFVRSIDYSLWSSALECCVWLEALFGLFLINAQSLVDFDSSTEVFIRERYNELSDTSSYFLKARSHSLPQGLYEFAQDVHIRNMGKPKK